MCFEQTKEANHFLCKKKIAFRVNPEIVVEFSQYGRRHRTGARLKVPVEQRNHSVPAGCPQETGHSSLSRLHSLPADVLKIDRSFIGGIEHDGESREIAHLIITLAHHLGLEVVAEGIETRSQLTYLEQFGCDFGQGYLFSRPVDHAALENPLAAASCDPAGSPVKGLPWQSPAS